MGPVERIGAIDVGVGAPAETARESRVETFAFGARPRHRVAIAQRHAGEGNAGRIDAGFMRAEADVARLDPETFRELHLLRQIADAFGQARQGEGGVTPLRARHLERAGHDADLLLEVERGFTGLAAAIDDGEEDGRPHGRMAREGQFPARREDAQARAMAGLRRLRGRTRSPKG